MRWKLCLVLTLTTVLIAGCGRQQPKVMPPVKLKAKPSKPTDEKQTPPRGQKNRETGEAPDSGEYTVDDETLQNMGLHDDPGGLPEYDGSAYTDAGLRIVVKYADLDNDGQREALTITQREKKAGGKGGPGASVAIFSWTGEKWWIWDQFRAQAGETKFDDDSIAFAYDLNRDGVVEVGLIFYKVDESSNNRERLYVYQAKDGELQLATGEVLLEMHNGAIEVTPEYSSMFLEDVTEDRPGEEIVVSQAKRSSGEAHAPYKYNIFVYTWKGDHYGAAEVYESVDRPDDADGAFNAFFDGTGEFKRIL